MGRCQGNSGYGLKLGTLPIFSNYGLPAPAVARYIERNPLKAGLAARPEAYRWSSAKAHLTEVYDAVLSSAAWLAPSEKAAYSEFVLAANDEMDDKIRKATCTGRPFGSESFVENLEFQLNQRLRPKKAGRPRKETGECP